MRAIEYYGGNKFGVLKSYESLGGNFRMDTIQAGFLNVLLKHAGIISSCPYKWVSLFI